MAYLFGALGNDSRDFGSDQFDVLQAFEASEDYLSFELSFSKMVQMWNVLLSKLHDRNLPFTLAVFGNY